MMGCLCAFGGVSSSSGSSAIDGKGRMMFLIKLTAKIGKTILLKSFWSCKQLCQILYQILIQPQMNYLILEICEFILSIQQLPQFSFEMIILYYDAVKIRLFLHQLLA